ncbi:MAG TPA: carboxylating.nicotinate-nucleotide diphosphorylase [Candidatus Kerfeldbacteria bacterium]|nr:carboxylating.nicotinate-nucleotide diphosphorylase [Candidatus Kerfeldbacteria bacterium]
MNIKQYYDRSAELTLQHPWYREQVERYLLGALHSDATTDVTSKKLIPRHQTSQAVIRQNQPGVLAGVEEIGWLLRKHNLFLKKLKISGRSRDILLVERTVLNTLQRLSGIATLTQQLIKKIGRYPLIAATRKTQWGALDKKAVALGGGYTHRLGLFDGVLVKDNHLALAEHDVLKHVRWGKQLAGIEVGSISQLKRVILHYPQFQILLLDNFPPEKIQGIVRWLTQQKLRKKYILEASGGITPENIMGYARTDVDVLSIGYLTHSAPALDISLDIIP